MRSALFLLAALVWSVQAYAQYPGYQTAGSYGPNKLRGSTLFSWFHGYTPPGSPDWCGEGVLVTDTSSGAHPVKQKVTNTLDTAYRHTPYACQVTGDTNVTDVSVRFVIESFDAASFANSQVTCQWPVKNLTGGSITPTLDVWSAVAQDDWISAPNHDISGVSLQAVANNATGVLSYTFAGSATAGNGLSIDIDFGNNFSTALKSILLGGGFNCRVTPGFPTGLVPLASYQQPDILPTALDNTWNRRFYTTSVDNGVTLAVVGHNGIQGGMFFSSTTGTFSGLAFTFGSVMRVAPGMAFYDGAGTASKVSVISGSTWTDGCTPTVTPGATTTGFFFPVIALSGCSSNALYLHYTADATLSGH